MIENQKNENLEQNSKNSIVWLKNSIEFLGLLPPKTLSCIYRMPLWSEWCWMIPGALDEEKDDLWDKFSPISAISEDLKAEDHLIDLVSKIN